MPWRLVDQPTTELRRRLVLILAVLTSVLAAAGTFAGVYAMVRLAHQQHDIKEAIAQIQKSRVVLSKQSCRQRNNERAIQRSNLRQNLAQLTKISDGALATLGYTRAEAEAQIHKQLRQVRPLDCKKLVRQVASNRARVSVGGGAGSNRAPRPHSVSEVETGPDGSSGASGPETPSQPRSTPHKPPSGGSGSGPSVGPPAGGGDGGVVNPKQGLVDKVKQTVEQVVPSDRVGELFDPVEKVVPPLP